MVDELRAHAALGAPARWDPRAAPRLAGESDEGMQVEARWNVMGSVGHWGHVHQRTNVYHANITVADVDGAWKLTGLDILEEERL